jgi:hypothetical protein
MNPGLSLEPMLASVSASAPFSLAAAVAGTGGSHQISRLPGGIFDQGVLPCCVSCALSSAMEVALPEQLSLAPLFHYHVTRFDNAGAADDGSLVFESGMGTLLNQGICQKRLHDLPLDGASALARPSDDAFRDGRSRALRRVGKRAPWEQPTGISNAVWIRDRLNEDRPVIVGFQLPQSYPGSFLDTQHRWADPNGMPLSGKGHCVIAVGYTDGLGFRIQDSRGPETFDRGYWWMGYAIVDSPIFQGAYCLLT